MIWKVGFSFPTAVLLCLCHLLRFPAQQQTWDAANFKKEWLPRGTANWNSSHVIASYFWPNMFQALSFTFWPPDGTVTSSENANAYGEAIALGFSCKFNCNHKPTLLSQHTKNRSHTSHHNLPQRIALVLDVSHSNEVRSLERCQRCCAHKYVPW
jgi:hypothetical protein